MGTIGEHVKTGDWKSEKHVPVIEAPDEVGKDELFTVCASIGKEVAHPNTTEHHIAWIALYFQPEGGKFLHEIARCTFAAHGASVEGPNTGPAWAHHEVTVQMKVTGAGHLHSVSSCNIHGLWTSSKDLKVRG